MGIADIVLIAALAASVVACICVILSSKAKMAEEKRRLEAEFGKEKEQLLARLTESETEKASLESRLEISREYESKMREDQDRRHQKDLEQMKTAFENLSGSNSEEFRMRSARDIAELLKPVQEKFRELTESMAASRKDSIERHSKLEQKIEDLDRQSKTVGDEARNLANALSGYSKVQGDFGEMLLTDVLKNAGLTEGIHFRSQGVMTDSEGREIRNPDGGAMIPDVQVFYPDDTVVIIDSKVSLKAYVRYSSAVTAEDRAKYAKAHVESIMAHVNELKDKDYASYLDPEKRKVSYNIMFIPMEGAFRLMLEEAPRLWQEAKDHNVLIVSQMTLLIVLNMIQMSWRRHDQEQNMNEIYATVSELMTQIGSWLAVFEKLGLSIDSVVKNYEESRKKLSDSGQSVIKKIKKLEKLGASPKRSRAGIKAGARMGAPGTVVPKSLDMGTDEITEERVV